MSTPIKMRLPAISAKTDLASFCARLLPSIPPAILINLVMAFIAIAVGVAPWTDLVPAIIACQLMGFIVLATFATIRWLGRRFALPAVLTALAYVGLGIPLALFAGRLVVLLVLHRDVLQPQVHSSSLSTLILVAGAGIFGIIYYNSRWRLAEERVRSAQAERAIVEARLRALQAQVEPHFLFNTLANLDAMIRESPDEANMLLANLNTYLRSSLTHARSKGGTLETEFALLDAYLRIMSMRLSTRLTSHVDCAQDCRSMPFPPMLLQPLIENAIVHGIEPWHEDGHIEVQASLRDEALEIVVRDTGIGLGNAPPSRGHGSGLSNVRERLFLLFGTEARLSLDFLPPHGTAAVMRIPVRLLSQTA